MGLVYALAGLLGLEVDVLISRLKQNAVAIGAVAVFVVIGVVFLLVAAYLGLAGLYGPLAAALIMAAAAFVVALVAYLVGRISARAQQRRVSERRRSGEATALLTTAAVAAAPLLPSVLRFPLIRKAIVPLAALAGIYLLLRPGPRSDPDEKP